MADEVKRAFGLAVALERRRRNFSQRYLADTTGIGRARMSRLEAGKGDATIDVQYRIARALGLTVTQLWERVALEQRDQRRRAMEESHPKE